MSSSSSSSFSWSKRLSFFCVLLVAGETFLLALVDGVIFVFLSLDVRVEGVAVRSGSFLSLSDLCFFLDDFCDLMDLSLALERTSLGTPDGIHRRFNPC